MSVSALFRLPYGPDSWDIAAGYTRVTPLGGDGYNNPHQSLNVRVSVTSDASGGTNTIQLDFDRRYATVVDWCSVGVSSPAADITNYISITKHIAGASGSFVINQDVIANDQALTSIWKQWLPPLEVYTPDDVSQDFINCVIPNVDTEIQFFQAKLLYWNRQALEKVPYRNFANSITPRN